MLVCPKCHFSNPNTNKFCQKCGQSLAYKVCKECGNQVEFTAWHCDKCGAVTGKTWIGVVRDSSLLIQNSLQAISQLADVNTTTMLGPTPLGSAPISDEETILDEDPPPPSPPNPAPPTEIAADTIPSAEELEQNSSPPMTAASETGAEMPFLEEKQPPEEVNADAAIQFGEYLDTANRYQVIEVLPSELPGESYLRVLDCQPLQPSPLLAFAAVRPHHAVSENQSNSMLGIPAIALPYLAARTSNLPSLPAIHDAWGENPGVLLLEDRTGLPRVPFDTKDNPPPTSEQILSWLEQSAQLWDILAPYKALSSLLKPENLFLADDDSGELRLGRLYPDNPDQPPTLTSLGQLWQQLLPNALELTPPEQSLAQLLNDLVAGEITTASELLGYTDLIAKNIKPNPDQLKLSVSNTVDSPQVSHSPISEMSADDSDDDDTPTMVMPLKLIALDAAGETDIGRQRNHNEDDFAMETLVTHSLRGGSVTSRSRSRQYMGLYIVADGMGGHDGGEIASATAVDSLRRYFLTRLSDARSGNSPSLPKEESIRSALLEANQVIYELNQQQGRSGSGRMGTTAVLALVQNTQVGIAHVGDSRIYRFTKSQGLQQMTVDHEVGQREIQRGVDPETAYSRLDAYQLTQALGPMGEDFIKPDVQFFNFGEDTLLVLASDGLTDNRFLETHSETHLAPLLQPDADLEQGVRELIRKANQHNGHDNITVVIVRALVQP
nr:serine/threonine phosphatase [[Phormidium] sp. ETS-05]